MSDSRSYEANSGGADASSSAAALPPILDCWYLSGPTAAGKTGVGIEMARLLKAEIVSLDSMAVYRGMDIGTDKPSGEQRRQIPHHMLDIRDPNEEFSVSDYVTMAHQVARQIRESGREVLFVGGTPMYLKAMLRGIYQGPPADWEFRRQVQQEVEQVGSQALHDRLSQVDPLAAAQLHPHDVRRMIRALEVYKITGRPLSHQQLQFEEGHPPNQCRVFVLTWPRPALHARIDRRVETMFQDGLVDEVQKLLRGTSRLGRTASQAVGYRETRMHLNGDISLDEAIRRTKVRTHQFARRQETWFRSLSECRQIHCVENTSPQQMARQLVELGKD